MTNQPQASPLHLLLSAAVADLNLEHELELQITSERFERWNTEQIRIAGPRVTVLVDYDPRDGLQAALAPGRLLEERAEFFFGLYVVRKFLEKSGHLQSLDQGPESDPQRLVRDIKEILPALNAWWCEASPSIEDKLAALAAARDWSRA